MTQKATSANDLSCHKMIESLSQELESMYQVAMQRRAASHVGSGRSAACEHGVCNCCGELEERIIGRRQTTTKKHGRNTGDFCTADNGHEQISSPISPSEAIFDTRLSLTTSSPAYRPSRPCSGADHQLCFGTESGEWCRDLGFGRRRCDSNGNSKTMQLSCDESSGISSCSTVDGMKPTHRATHRFIPRHDDEMLLDIGDPIFVEHEAEDLWCTGSNLRTGQRGVFPVSHAFELDFEDDCGPISSLRLHQVERETFYLTLLGTVEVAYHKGNDVLVQAINKVLHFYQSSEEIVVPLSVLLDVSFRGIHIIDKSRKNLFRCPNFDYFYSLQNISFCGAHPKQLRYFSFITKHPLLPRFACHVFLSNSNTQSIVDAVGRAFRRSYDEYMAFANPTEDIFLE